MTTTHTPARRLYSTPRPFEMCDTGELEQLLPILRAAVRNAPGIFAPPSVCEAIDDVTAELVRRGVDVGGRDDLNGTVA